MSGGLSGAGLVLLTGASGGWGRACAIQLARVAEEGSRLVLVARREADLKETEALVKQASSTVSTAVVVQDLGDTDALTDRWLSDALGPLEGFEYCLLINNAGSLGSDLLLRDVTPVEAKKIQQYEVMNVISPLVLTGAYLRYTGKISRRFVVNVSSLCAIKPFPSLGLYCAGKASRDMHAQVLALEERSLRVLSYAPGPMRTRMTQEGAAQAGHASTKGMFTGIVEGNNSIEPETSAQRLLQLLKENSFRSGEHIDVFD